MDLTGGATVVAPHVVLRFEGLKNGIGTQTPKVRPSGLGIGSKFNPGAIRKSRFGRFALP
jgi:hypothetical protein